VYVHSTYPHGFPHVHLRLNQSPGEDNRTLETNPTLHSGWDPFAVQRARLDEHPPLVPCASKQMPW
jgi:hypothetical protein